MMLDVRNARRAQRKPTPRKAAVNSQAHGVGAFNEDSSETAIDGNDEWSEYDRLQWGLPKAPLCGVISSEEEPEPATSLLLDVVKGERRPDFSQGRRARPLPRIWTPADGIRIMVPQSPVPVPPDEQAPFASYAAEDFRSETSRARGKARKRAADRARSKAAYAFKAACKAMTAGQRCPDCNVELSTWHICDRRPVFAVRDGKSVLVCRKCNGGKHVSAEAEALAGIGRGRDVN